ncbi:MAG: hypothetical protein WD963_01680 [Candidatus Paceibacterota bacterium]
MGALLFKIWYLVVVLPFLIFLEGWAKLSKFLDKGDRRAQVYDKGIYFVLAVLVLLLLILLLLGY